MANTCTLVGAPSDKVRVQFNSPNPNQCWAGAVRLKSLEPGPVRVNVRVLVPVGTEFVEVAGEGCSERAKEMASIEWGVSSATAMWNARLTRAMMQIAIFFTGAFLFDKLRNRKRQSVKEVNALYPPMRLVSHRMPTASRLRGNFDQ